MSIRGIDAQIMVSRSPDLARDASAMMKRPEVTQEFLAVQKKMSDAHDQSRVKGTEQAEMENIRTDVDGGSGSAHGGTGGGTGKDEDEVESEIAKSMLVPPGNNVIDIRV